MVRFHLSLTQIAMYDIPYPALKQIAVNAEKLGYDGLTHADRLIRGAGEKERWSRLGMSPSQLNSFSLMASLASATDRVLLRTIVFDLPVRNPIDVANVVATIDKISGGRFILMVWSGGDKAEFEAVKLPFEAKDEIFEEQLQVMKALWTQDKVTFHGKHFDLNGVALASVKPAQSPHPPIWVGTRDAGPDMLRLIGRFASGWHEDKGTSQAEIRSKLKVIREEAKMTGRDESVVRPSTTRVLALAKDDAAAKKMASDFLAKTGGNAELTLASGNPGTCIANLKQLVEAGITDFSVNFIPYTLRENLEMIDLFAKEVIPAFE